MTQSALRSSYGLFAVSDVLVQEAKRFQKCFIFTRWLEYVWLRCDMLRQSVSAAVGFAQLSFVMGYARTYANMIMLSLKSHLLQDRRQEAEPFQTLHIKMSFRAGSKPLPWSILGTALLATNVDELKLCDEGWDRWKTRPIKCTFTLLGNLLVALWSCQQQYRKHGLCC